jgi:AcrR family transcriptional regulator
MQERSMETRVDILASAEKLFSQKGYEATSVADICADADISKGALYHHFPTKHALFMTLLEDWLKTLDQQMLNFTDSLQSVPQSLIQMADMLGFVFQSAGGRLSMFLEFWAQASRNKIVWQTTIAPYRHYHQQFTELVKRGVKEGSLETDNPQITAWVILALATGVLMQGLLDPEAARWDEVGKYGLRTLMNGLKKE